MEQWKDIAGYEGMYQVSDMGQVRSLDRFDDRGRHLKGRVLAQSNTSGYLCVNPSIDGKATLKYIHRFVAEVFIPNPDNRPQVNHMDGNKQNNHISNLEWATAKENSEHAWDTGLVNHSGENHTLSKLTEDDVRFIRKHYNPDTTDFNQKTLAEKFGVEKCTISQIVHRKTWKHVA